MLGARLLILPLLGLSVFAGKATAGAPQTAIITRAAIAPYLDAVNRDAAALCGDLVPAVAAELVQGATPGVGCTAAVSSVFALTAPNEPPPQAGLSFDPTIQDLEVSGQHATAELKFTFLTVTNKSGVSKVAINSAGPTKLEFEEVGGTWLVSSQARLITYPGCRLSRPLLCSPGALVLRFTVGEIEPTQPFEGLPTPTGVKRAGGRRLDEFEAGKRVLAQTGCLACHRIGDIGNAGPGQNLTHVGSKLSEAEIAHALVDPRAPMPSFRRLPARKFHDVVRFLALLR